MAATITQKKITGQQRLFIRHYIQTGKGKLSALKAGYSPKSVAAIASQLLNNPRIASEIQRQNKILQSRLEITQESLVKDAQFLKEKAIHGEPIYDEDGDLLSIVGMDDKLAVSLIQTQARLLGIGGYGGAKLEVSGEVTHTHKHEYNLKVLDKDEKLELIRLLAKCRIQNPEEKQNVIEGEVIDESGK